MTMLDLRIALPLLAAALIASPATAQDVADFYRGKRLTIVVGYGAGGGYDIYARQLARFFGEHLPGQPKVVVQNMPGAGSRAAANWLYNLAPKDGSVLGSIGQTTPIDQTLGEPGIQFDARRFAWLGNMIAVNNIIYVSATSGIRSIDDAKTREVIMGGSGATSPSIMYPQVSNNLLGTHFRIVSGYTGGSDILLAMERGEIAGRGSDSWATLKSTHPDWLRDGKVRILFQIGTTREADLPDVPLWSELAPSQPVRQILEILSADVVIGRPLLAPPGVPADRIAALRTAFTATMADQSFREAAKAAAMDIKPIDGETLQRHVERIVSAPPEVIAAIHAAMKTTDVKALPRAQPETAGRDRP